MPSSKNIQLLEETKAKVEKSTALFFVDYAGLTHKQLEEARNTLRDQNSEIAVVKNTLMILALKDKNLDGIAEKLQGPQATLFAYEDGIKTAKTLADFIKKHGLPKIKFGIFEDKVVDREMVMTLSKLPSKEILVGKLLGLLNSPISKFVYALNGNITKLALVLKEIEKKKATN
jgi:large subunit ribosomal protein L10